MPLAGVFGHRFDALIGHADGRRGRLHVRSPPLLAWNVPEWSRSSRRRIGR